MNPKIIDDYNARLQSGKGPKIKKASSNIKMNLIVEFAFIIRFFKVHPCSYQY